MPYDTSVKEEWPYPQIISSDDAGAMVPVEIAFSGLDVSPWMQGFSEHARQHLAALGRVVQAPAGAHLMSAGEETRELDLLTAGQVALVEFVHGRGPATMLTVQPGEFFGWSALLPPYRATCSARALGPVSMVIFDAGELRAAMAEDHELAEDVYRIAFESVAHRLLAVRRLMHDLYWAEEGEPW